MEHDIWCNGDHEEEDDCNDPLDECDPRCLGHFGEPDCNPCPDRRCTQHAAGDPNTHEQLCGLIHCQGHEWDGTNMECSVHAAWCEIDHDADTTACWGDECTRALPGGLILKTQLRDGKSEIDREGIWGPRSAQDATDAAEGMQIGAELLEVEETYLAQRET